VKIEYQGTLYLYHQPAQAPGEHAVLRVIVENHGPSTGILTHNFLPDEALAKNLHAQTHDDHIGRDIRGGIYGHGDDVRSGTPNAPVLTEKTFGIGGTYSPYIFGEKETLRPIIEIAPGAWFRAGFRTMCNFPVQVPGPNEYIEIPFEYMRPARGEVSRWPVIPMKKRKVPAFLAHAIRVEAQNLAAEDRANAKRDG
jgi:hypothetical protein